MNAIFEGFQVNSISVSRNDYIECYIFILNHSSFQIELG